MDQREDILERAIQANRHTDIMRHVVEYLQVRLARHTDAMVSIGPEFALRQQQGMAMELKHLTSTFMREPRKTQEN